MREHLPRTDHAQLLAVLGVPSLPLVTPTLDLLSEAAAAAAALPHIGGRSLAALAARAAALTVGLDAHRLSQVAAALAIHPAAARRLRRAPPDTNLALAIQHQLSLRSQVAAPAYAT